MAPPQLLARGVTAAMLEVKKKSISLLLQLYFHENSSRKNCFVLTFNIASRLVTLSQTKKIALELTNDRRLKDKSLYQRRTNLGFY